MARILGVSTVGPCGGCCGELGLTWICESLTGTASLCGISAYSADASPYDPFNPDSWEGQYRKWSERTLSGSLDRREGACATCPGDSGASGALYEYSGTYEVTCIAETPASVTRTLSAFGGPSEPCAAGAPSVYNVTELDLFFFTPVSTCPADLDAVLAPVSQAYTLLTRTVSGCGCHTPNGTSYTETLGTAIEELPVLSEVYFYDALEAEGGAIEGESCCTELEEADQTSPQSIMPMSMTGTGVKVTITVLGGDPLTDYLVTITLEQANDFPDPPTVWEVALTVKGSTPTAYYPPLPIPGDYPICVTDVRLGS